MADKKNKDTYLLKDRTVVPMTALTLTPSYPLEYYEANSPTPVSLQMFKLVLACPAVGSGIKKSDLVNPEAPAGTGVPVVEVFVAVRKDADGVKSTFWNGDKSSAGQMFVSMKAGRSVLRGTLFKTLASDLNLDLSKQGVAMGAGGKDLATVYVRVGYSPGSGTSYAPKNTYRGHAKDRNFFAEEEVATMGALASAGASADQEKPTLDGADEEGTEDNKEEKPSAIFDFANDEEDQNPKPKRSVAKKSSGKKVSKKK